ncbi:MAG: hypothetical protein R3B09_28335 [Nannocystaceae bacterium]
MFEHYMNYQYADPRRQRQMTLAATVSGVLTLSMITFAWAANKMDIARVEAPTINYIVFQLAMDEPPPPPPPPPPPAGSEEEEEEEEKVPDEEIPEEEIVQPKETPEKVPDAKKAPGKSAKIPGGVPGGIPGGVPGGVVGGVLGGQLGGQLGGVAVKRDNQQAAPPIPINAVMSQGVYVPDPDDKLLKSTKASMFDKRPCVSKVFFCVDTNGKTTDVRTKGKCYDPKVDEICRETVKKWRFKPFIVGGKTQKQCSTMEFSLKFNK